MKKTLTLALSLCMSAWMMGQDLPQPSPAATVQQRVGLTDITVEYSRPAMKGREIFGGLVPMGEMWRTGANKATAVTFSTDVTVNGQTVPAGKYSLFTIPNEGEWTIILNGNTELWGVDGYESEKDVLRYSTTPETGDAVESMRISLENVSSEGAELVVAWDKTRASMLIEVNTHDVAMSNIQAAMDEKPEDWRVYRNAANYYKQNDIDNAQALKWIERSLELNAENWYSHYMHAELLAANGRDEEAKDAAQTALEMGRAAAEDNGGEFNYAPMIETFISNL